MDAHGPRHASGYLRPQGLRLLMCKMGTILCGRVEETRVLESASKHNTSLPTSGKGDIFLPAAGNLTFVFPCIFIHIQVPQVWSFLKIPIPPPG